MSVQNSFSWKHKHYTKMQLLTLHAHQIVHALNTDTDITLCFCDPSASKNRNFTATNWRISSELWPACLKKMHGHNENKMFQVFE